MAQCLLGRLQMLQSDIIVRLIFRHLPEGLRFLQVLILRVAGFRNLLELFVGFAVFPVANPSHCLLHAVSQPVGFIVRIADGFVIFRPGLLLVPHQGVGVSQSKLRGHEVRIDLQRRTIVPQ